MRPHGNPVLCLPEYLLSVSTCIYPTNLPGVLGGKHAADPHGPGWAVLPPPCSPPRCPKSHTGGRATRPPRPGHTAATVPVASCPTAVPSLRPTVPRSGNLPPKGRAEGWVPTWRAAGPPEAPAALPRPLGCAQKSTFMSKNLSGESCMVVLCHLQPRRQLAAASVRSFGDRNSAAKEKFNSCRERPCSRLRKTETGPSAAEPRAEEEKSLGRADEGERESHRSGVLGLRDVPPLRKPLDNPHALMASVGRRKSFLQHRRTAGASGRLGAAPVTASPQESPVVRASQLSLQPPLSRGSGGAQGTQPLIKGVLRAGTWGRDVPHCPAVLREGGWGSTWALAEQGHHAAAAWSHGCLPVKQPLAVGCIRGQPHHRRAARGLQATTTMQELGEPSHLALVPGG